MEEQQQQDLIEFESARKEGLLPARIFKDQEWKEEEGEYLGTGRGYSAISTCTRAGILYKVWQGMSAHRIYTHS